MPVRLSQADVDFIAKETFVDSDIFSAGVAEKNKIRFDFSLEDIEGLLGYVAAEANHTESPKLRKRLDRIADYLQTFLDSYDDQD